LEYNGGCVVAMAGKNCVAIASDKRLGVQLVRLQFLVLDKDGLCAGALGRNSPRLRYTGGSLA